MRYINLLTYLQTIYIQSTARADVRTAWVHAGGARQTKKDGTVAAQKAVQDSGWG